MQSDLDVNSSTNRQRSDRKWLWLCAAIVFGAVVTRFLYLADKPFHHDESLHAYYSNRVALGHPHEYSALLHGPVLYYLTGAFMAVFGASEFLARVPAALCSVVLVVLPLFWKKLLGKPIAAAIAILFLLSPTMMYFGRFLREDAFNSLWIVAGLSSFFAFLSSQSPRHAILATAFLALQFCNKENSFLHLFVWLSGYVSIFVLFRRLSKNAQVPVDIVQNKSMSKSDKIVLVINCASLFSFIFILFYSSFFRHSKGAWHGVLDGLYRESLLYWWEQNQKRRIDGPFDYHFPIFLNYEFALVPAIIFAWLRSVRMAVKTELSGTVGWILCFLKRARSIAMLFIVAVAFLFLPRIGLSPSGCSISEYCATEIFSQPIAQALGQIGKLLHIAHTRHLIQIILMLVFGAIAFFASVQNRRSVDSFLWWWFTGAVGIYSYVGEKVPWLLIYIVLPAALIAGIEIGRQWTGWMGMRGGVGQPLPSKPEIFSGPVETQFSRKVGQVFLFTTAGLLTFATYKALRVSFVTPSSPHERLVFTQTTESIASIRTRWEFYMLKNGVSPKVTISGDATWPMSWYGYDLRGLGFSKPKDAAEAETYDAFFLDRSELDFAYNIMNSFDIYEVPLRHWWVPKPNPSGREILEYFLTGRPYPRELEGSPIEQGIGDATVLYLENRQPGRFFSKANKCECGRMLRDAQLGMSREPDGIEK